MVGSITLARKQGPQPTLSMPELPEVEVVRRGLGPQVCGATVRAAQVREARLRWPVPVDLEARLAGRTVLAVERRGKYLLLDVGNGTLIVHLGMSGTLRWFSQAPPLIAHDHVDIVTDRGVLRYNDPRRFGAMLWHDASDGPVVAHSLLANLGIEPFDARFDGAWLYRASRGRRVSVKQWLLAGHCVVGVGNIYASESLFRAGIRPTVAAARLSRARCDLLAQAIRATLAEAIERGGSSLRDFVGSDGSGGYFQLDCGVYGRAGEPCRVCAAPVKLIRQQQRATYFCATCQPR